MEILYHGHSCVQISDGLDSLIIDPFISGNPKAVTKPENVKVQYILLTHAHGDHISDAIQIAKLNDATIIATFELANYLNWKGAKTFAINIGGTYDLGFGKVQMVQAFHSSSIVLDEEQKIIYGGMPGGFVLKFGGFTVLHCGDTGLFSDMKMIGERNSIDLAFIPIGDTFTMGPEEAAVAAQWLNARYVVPIHYNTFPPIVQDGVQFVRSLEEFGIQGKAMQPGEVLNV